jgi:IS5 family transposase
MKLVKKKQPGVDNEARYLKKGKKLHFGYTCALHEVRGKKHTCTLYEARSILTDENGMQLSVYTTTANEHDSKGLKPCLENQDEELAITECLTDKGYQVPDTCTVYACALRSTSEVRGNVELFKSPIKNKKVKNRIQHKAYRNRPLTEWQKKYNRLLVLRTKYE